VLANLDVPWAEETGDAVIAINADGLALPLAFDHATILGHAVKRIRGKLDYARIAFAFLPETFTLRALQAVYEVILGRTLNKPAFRRRMLDTGWIEPTGTREDAAAFRPAELYRLKATTPAPHITAI
jgi:8-oxo-dGTP diphosphatase